MYINLCGSVTKQWNMAVK